MVWADALVMRLPASTAAERPAAITANFFMSTPPIRRLLVTTCAYGLKATRPGRTDWDDETFVVDSPAIWGASGIGDAGRSISGPADIRRGAGYRPIFRMIVSVQK